MDKKASYFTNNYENKCFMEKSASEQRGFPKKNSLVKWVGE